MNADMDPRETLMDPQQVTLQVVMVDDEEALCLGVRRIIEKYRVHVPDVLVDASYSFRYFTSGEDFLAYLEEGGERRPAAAGPQAAGRRRHGRAGRAQRPAAGAVLTIMITAYATFETAVKATKLGAYDFLRQAVHARTSCATRCARPPASSSSASRRASWPRRSARCASTSSRVLAHELKAPLNAVEGYLNILRSTTTSRDRQMVERSMHARRRHEEAHLRPARPHAHRVRPAAARHQALDLRALARASMELFAVRRRSDRGITMELVGRPPMWSCWPTRARSRSCSTTSSPTP